MSRSSWSWGRNRELRRGVPSPGIEGHSVDICPMNEQRSNCRPNSQRVAPGARTWPQGAGLGCSPLRAARADPAPCPSGYKPGGRISNGTWSTQPFPGPRLTALHTLGASRDVHLTQTPRSARKPHPPSKSSAADPALASLKQTLIHSPVQSFTCSRPPMLTRHRLSLAPHGVCWPRLCRGMEQKPACPGLTTKRADTPERDSSTEATIALGAIPLHGARGLTRSFVRTETSALTVSGPRTQGALGCTCGRNNTALPSPGAPLSFHAHLPRDPRPWAPVHRQECEGPLPSVWD